jgi:hypothetical protein
LSTIQGLTATLPGISTRIPRKKRPSCAEDKQEILFSPGTRAGRPIREKGLPMIDDVVAGSALCHKVNYSVQDARQKEKGLELHLTAPGPDT